MGEAKSDWWSRDDLHYRDGRLLFAGRDLGELAARFKGPVFFYSLKRVEANLRRLAAALADGGLEGCIHYAMKANRFMPLLARMKGSGLCGIDACSPGEVVWALQCGFEAADLSYTNTSVSDDDLETLVRHPEMWLNLDSLSSIRRLGERAPGRTIGLRVNPALGVGYGDNELLRYSKSGATTKFGIYQEQFDEALETAARYGLQVKGIHFHTGCGYLSSQLPLWGEILERCRGFLDRLDEPQVVNLGGGLGVPHQPGDEPLELARWSGEIRRVFGGRGLRVWVEPGDYVVKDAGVLVLQANTVERKRETLFIGVDGGFNLAIEPAFYHLPCAPLPCRVREGEPVVATIAGNINEALDLWAKNARLTPVEEGDRIAFINAGGYASAMSSNHCVRGRFSEFLLD